MAPPALVLPSVTKVVAVISALWAIACAVMFWSMHYSSRTAIFYYLMLAGVPIALMWVLVMVARRLDKRTRPPEPKRRITASGRDKERSTR